MRIRPVSLRPGAWGFAGLGDRRGRPRRRMRRRGAGGLVFAGVLAGLLPWTAVQAEQCTEDAMIVFDGSGSMAETGFNNIGGPRIIEARTAMRKVIPQVAQVRRLGLMTYGPGAEESACRNIALALEPEWGNGPLILSEVDGLEPEGETPLTDAVRRAAEVLGYRTRPGVVVLVTDGRETCGGATCELAAELAADGFDLTVHVIGFKVRGDHFRWDGEQSGYNAESAVARCLADRTGGQYVGAESVGELIAALRVTLGCNVFGSLDTGDGIRRLR